MKSKLNNANIQLKNGRYYLIIYDSDKNKQVWRSLNLTKNTSKREINKRAYEVFNQYKNSKKYNEEADILFSDFLRSFFESTKNSLALTTQNGYENMLNTHILPYFDRKKILLKDLSVKDIEEYYLFKESSSLCSTTVHKHHELIHSALNFAVKKNLITTNVSSNASNIPKIKHKEIDFYDEDELNTLISNIHSSVIFIPLILTIFFGLRRSEVLGIKWDAINFDKKTLHIKSSLLRISENKKIRLITSTVLKTPQSIRCFYMPDKIIDILKKHKESIEENKNDFGNEYNKKYEEFVCVKPNGDLISPDFFSQKFKNEISKIDIKKSVTLHGLRHSTASFLLCKGHGMKSIQVYLGHSNYNTTANTYSHINNKEKQNMCATMNELKLD